jgi:hypothetical protein
MTRQLDLLISQDRSAQMLMDKTLGAASVVTQDNLGEIFQEMLHPHLEEERKKLNADFEKERARGKSELEQAAEQLNAAKKAESAATSMLDANLREDGEIVRALCRELSGLLDKKRKRNKAIGLMTSVILCAPIAIWPSEWAPYMSFVFAVFLAYLSVTGTKLIGTATSKKDAMLALSESAGSRSLSPKLSRFDIDWRNHEYIVSEKSRENLEDLFGSSTST